MPHPFPRRFLCAFASLLLAGMAIAKTPTSIEILGSDEAAETSAEPFFAKVTYTDQTEAIVIATWTNGFNGAVSAERIFTFPAPAVASDQAGQLSVTYTEDGTTVSDTHAVTVNNVPLTGPGALTQIHHHTEPRLLSRAAYSVDTATGAHVIEKQLMNFRATTELAVIINYNSLFTSQPGTLGPGWHHNFDLKVTGDPTGVVTVHYGPEIQTRFRYLETIGQFYHYVPLDRGNRHDILTRSVSGAESYNLFTVEGLRLDFNREGLLVDYRNKVRQGSVFSYFTSDPGTRLANVHDSLQLRGFTFAYDDGGRAQTVTDHTDRIVRFRYDSIGRLNEVTQPYYVDSADFNNGAIFEPGVLVPDNDPQGAEFPLTVSRAEPIGEVVFNYINIDYNRFEDLKVSLISPAGTELVIRDHETLPNGASRLDLANESYGAFQGENPQGQWRIKVVDDVAGGSNFEADISPFSLSFSSPTNPTFYDYDENDRLIEARDSIGRRLFANTYDAQGRIATQDDGVTTNQPAAFAYAESADGTIETIFTDRMGVSSTFVHDGRLRLLSWTDPLGNETTYDYDAVGNRTAITDPLGRRTGFAYDAGGNLVTLTDPAGNVSRFFYDEFRNVTRIRDALGKETNFEYDGVHNMTKATDADGNTLVKTYNTRSQLLSTELHDGSRIDFTYDNNGDLASATHPVDPAQKAETDFDDLGRVIKISDAGKFNTLFEYSPSGLLLKETDYAGDEIVRDYDERDRIVSETDKMGNVTAFAYDDNDNRVSVTDALGNVTQFAFDGEDRLISETDALGRTTTYTYDGLGRRIAITDPLGRTRRIVYDAVGNAVREMDASNATIVTRAYDELDLPTRVSDAFGNTIDMEYDAVGRLTAMTDPLGNETLYTYDVLDRLSSVLDPLNRVARRHYAPDDMTTRVETPGAADTIFEYDAANRLTRILKGTYKWREFFYDDYRDLVTKEHLPSNTGINYEYDGLGRLLVQSGGAGRIEYTYDDNGNLLNSEEAGLTLTRTYDELNRVKTFTDAAGGTIGYEYDAVGNLTTLTYPGGDTVSYEYDQANRLVRVTDWAARMTTFAYDTNDRVTRIDFPNGTFRVMTYDVAGQVVRRVDRDAGGTLIVGYDFTFDEAGRITSQYPLHPASSFSPPATSMTFNDRYQAVTFNGSAINYNGDGAPTSTAADGGIVNVTFLANGTVWSIDGDVFEHDPESRLFRVTDGAGTSTLTTNPHAGLSQVLEKTASDDTVTRYVYGIGLLYDVSGGDIRVYHYDNRGSTVALTGNTGNVAHRFNYGPFGESIGNDTSVTPFLFAGLYGVYTESHGLCNMRTRWYSPQMRRYISRDTYLGDTRIPTTLNTWSYALNNPISFEDPEGEFINIVVGAVAGAIGGVVVQGISDLVQGKEPQWQDYVSAAAGGALTGALIGSGAGAIYAGVVGSAFSNSLNQTLHLASGNQSEFDFGSFALETAIGGAGGAAGGRLGRVSQGVIGPAWRKQVVYKGLLYSSKGAVRKGAAREIASTVAVEVVTRGSVGLATALGRRELARLNNTEPTVTQSIRGRQRFNAVRAYVERNLRELKGEYLHFDLYQNALLAADLPLPASPNNTLTEY